MMGVNQDRAESLVVAAGLLMGMDKEMAQVVETVMEMVMGTVKVQEKVLAVELA